MKQPGIRLKWLVVCLLWPVATIQAWQDALDLERIKAAGLQVQAGQHLTLITDARDRADVAQFTTVFDLAVEQWCQYFSIDPQRTARWRVTGCVMVDRERFVRAGLFPDDLPIFPAGYQRGSMLWLYAQQGDYYTRHLLLHEGTHAFMQAFLGDFGPPWYAEGMAELLAVHRWADGQLEINHKIADRVDVPWWGRVKLVRTDRDAGRGLTLDEVMALPADSFRQVNAYGWAWAVCEFFDRHPQTGSAFRRLPDAVQMNEAQFNRHWRTRLASQLDSWAELETVWQMMIDEIEYGYDVASAVPVAAAASRSGDSVTVQVATARGWQRTGITVEAGREYEFTTSGMFQIRCDEQSWPCDAGGVTIEYYRGRPLGQLLATVLPDGTPGTGLLPWQGIGRSAVWSFATRGELWLRVNESPSAWSDNQGELTVTIRPVSD